MNTLINAVAKRYQAKVHSKLAKYGLRYEDILIMEHPDYTEALKWLPMEEKIARERRIRRAMDLSAKHETLPKEIQALQTPGKFYMADLMAELAKIREEREKLTR